GFSASRRKPGCARSHFSHGLLIQALHSERLEGAQWAILRCLGALRARDAVTHIVPLLEDRRSRTAAHESLVRIVGQDLGPAGEPYMRWLQGAGEVAEEKPGATVLLKRMTGHNDDRLMFLALRGAGAEYESPGGGRYVLKVPVGKGRTQTAFVSLSTKDHQGSLIAVVYADCGPADPKHYEYALKRNFKMPYGAMALRDTNKGPYFVMFNSLLRESLSPLELNKSIFTIAERAARVMQDLEEGREPGSSES
ncbi:MAG: hypothetical protein QGH74_02670, partial [Candidatus Brocadiia bacterium]|nr:hypothetical protein [Candidatus Brocadiia bacterium]